MSTKEGKERKKKACEEKEIIKKKKGGKRRYKVPRWVENRKATHAKIRGIPLGWKSSQNLGIMLKGGMGSLQRSLLLSYGMHPSH